MGYGDKYYVYGLFNTETNELVYVGRTMDPKTRFICHLNTTAKDFRNTCSMEILDEGFGTRSVDEAFWIEYALFMGCNLRNKATYRKRSRAESVDKDEIKYGEREYQKRLRKLARKKTKLWRASWQGRAAMLMP